MMRVGALLTVMILVAMTWAPAPAATSTSDYLVSASGAWLHEQGYTVVDDYGSFATAALTPTEAEALAASGIQADRLHHVISRGRATVDPADEATAADEPVAYHLVQFRGPIKAEWRTALETMGLRVYDYLPPFTLLVDLGDQDPALVSASASVRAVAPYSAAYKVSTAFSDHGVVDATVIAYSDVDLDQLVANLRGAGASVMSATTAQLDHVIDVVVSSTQLADLALIPEVAWIEPSYNEGTLDNAYASAITQSSTLNDYSVHDKGIDGRSQVVSVCDTGVNTNAGTPTAQLGTNGATVVSPVHEMFADDNGTNLIQYNHHNAPVSAQDVAVHRKVDLYYSAFENGNRGDADDGNGHGTHTAGTIAGDAPPYGVRNAHDGVAFAAALAVCDVTTGQSFNILGDYSNYWTPAYSQGARINSNSWGSGHTSTYTEKARQHDAFTWENRDFLILRSMGNIASLIRTSASAKSAMGIGSTDNGNGMDQVSSFSGSGPTQDGRIKPNAMAPGACLTSAYIGLSNRYVCLSGTSMSTPTVAGAATLVRDYLVRGFYPSGMENAVDGFNPSSALVRAMLQISGKEMSGDRGAAGFPNNVQGWGRVTLDDVLFFDGDSRQLLILDEATALSTGDVETTNISVSAGQPLRVMVAWSDQAGAAGANPALVNDLDLIVSGPDGVRIGNAFVASQVPPGPAAADTRNVEEAVYIHAPVAGTYTIKVQGTNIPQGPQPYALVVTGAAS